MTLKIATTKTALLEHWKERAKNHREVADQYQHFEKDQMFKLGAAFGIEMCLTDLELWEVNDDKEPKRK